MEEINYVVIQQGIGTAKGMEFRIYSTADQLKSGHVTWSIVQKNEMDEASEVLTGVIKPTKRGIIGNLKKYLKTFLL
jgi:hypothetical protein